MTSNQVAYYGVAETQRHNEQVEEETRRYNDVTAELKERELFLLEQKNMIQDTYNTRSLDLQEQYNDWYMRFTEANEAEKRSLEAEGNSIQKQIADAEAEYKSTMGEVQTKLANVQSDLAVETKRHNAELEEINKYSNTLTEQLNQYRADQWEAENKLKNLEINTEYSLGIMRGELEGYRMNLEDERARDLAEARNQIDIRIANIDKEAKLGAAGISAGGKLLDSASQLVMKLVPVGKAGTATSSFYKLLIKGH